MDDALPLVDSIGVSDVADLALGAYVRLLVYKLVMPLVHVNLPNFHECKAFMSGVRLGVIFVSEVVVLHSQILVVKHHAHSPN